MYFGSNDEINMYDTLDIDGDKDIIRFNRHEMDNKSRKNIASYLRDRVLEQDETLKIVLTDEDIDFSNIDTLCIGDLEFRRKRFKNSYNNVKIFLVIKNGDDSYFLKEGYRYLSREESCHAVDLIDKSGNVTFSVDKDVWVEIRKS